MKAFRLAAIALLFLPLGLESAHATCPYGNTYDDGCAAAPTDGNFQQSDFFTYAKQSGQGSYYNGSSNHLPSAHPPAWNVPGVDYPVGYPTGMTLKDPASDTLPSGCSYSATGSVLGGGKVTCNGTGSLTLSGWDFSLHDGIPLLINTSPSSVAITDSKFQMGTNISQVQGAITGSISGNTLTMTALVNGSAPTVGQVIQNVTPSNQMNTSQTTVSAVVSAWNGMSGTYTLSASCTISCGSQNFYVGKVQGYMIALVNPSTASFDFEDNYVKGDEANFPLAQTACLWINGTSGSLTFKYNAIIDCGRPETSNSYGDDLWKYNYVDTFARSVSDGHGEIDFHAWTNHTTANVTYSFNTVVLGSAALANNSTTIWYPTATNGGITSVMTHVKADHNVTVTNTNSGTVTVAAAVAEIDGATSYIDCIWDTNYFDPTGALFAFGSVGGASCSSTFSHNVNMLNGNAATSYNTIP